MILNTHQIGTHIENYKELNNQCADASQVIKNNCNTLLNKNNYTLDKEDIIAAILMGEGCYSEPNAVRDLMDTDYFELYEELADIICENACPYYTHQGFDLVYNESDLHIYMQDSKTTSDDIKLDVNLIPSEDLSDITIELSYQGNIMFIQNGQASGITNFLPVFLNEMHYFQDADKTEHKLLEEHNYHTDTLISAIVSNFSESIFLKEEIINNLTSYTRFQLMEILCKIISDLYDNILINPFCPLLLQRVENEKIEHILYQLVTNQNTNETSIVCIDNNGNQLFRIGT